MAACSLTIRLDSDLKEEAASIVEHYGLDLSSVTRAFFTQIVNTNAIPLSFDYERPNEETLASMREADEIIARGAPGYSSAEEMFAAMGL